MSGLFITVDVRSVYGKEAIYPVDAAARTFARIAGTTTLTRETLREVEALGYVVRRAAPGLAASSPIVRVTSSPGCPTTVASPSW